MKFLSTSVTTLRATMLALLIVTACCILKNISVSDEASHSHQSSVVKKDKASNHDNDFVIHGYYKEKSTKNNLDRILQSLNDAAAGLLPSNGQWVPFGNTITGKAAGDHFGHSVATSKSGNFVIVGATHNADNGRSSGHAQVFEYKVDTKKWEKIGGNINGEKALDSSGYSVDINEAGDVVIVGAPGNGGNGFNSGHARVYRLVEGEWVKQGLDLDGTSEWDQFGSDVAISRDGRRVIIGGPTNDGNGSDSGLAQIYEYKEDTQKWEQIGSNIVGEAAGDRNGCSVDMDDTGEVVIVGAKYHDRRGHARVYQYISGQWVKKGQDLNGVETGEEFGAGVAISKSGNSIIVGGPRFSGDNGYDFGHAQVFEYKDNTRQWEKIGRDIVGENDYDRMGESVDINDTGDVIIVGAELNDGYGYSAGHARVYRLIDEQWIQQGEDLDGIGGDKFGRSVAISGDGDKIIIGGPDNSDNGFISGYVRAFVFKQPTAQPSFMPTIQPSLSKVPSLAPSLSASDSPTLVSTCNDSPLKILTAKGKKSAKTCQIIAKKSGKFCDLKKNQDPLP